MRKALIAAAVIGLVACGQALSRPGISLPSPKPFQPPTSWAVAVSSDLSVQHSRSLTRIDAASLKDAQSPVPTSGFMTASADGSTLVEVDYQADNGTSVQVVDARSGAVRASFQPAFAIAPVLTPDGSRMLVTEQTGHLYRVLDTSTGQVIGKLETMEPICCGLFAEWLDPNGRFAYGISTPGSGMTAKGPVTPVLIRYDLQTGRENGRLTLNGVQAGLWQTDRVIGSMHITTELVPGAALSPDGAQMAILYDDGSRLMTIDTVGMKVLASRLVTLPPSPSSWFGLRPIETEAKAEEGITWSLAYAPDGRRLVAWGRQMTFDQQGTYATHGLGVRTIDVRTASVIAQSPTLDVERVYFAPDASAIYATSWITGTDYPQTLLMRLDATNLSVAARRQFSGPRDLLILAT